MERKDLEIGMLVKNINSNNIGKIHEIKAFTLTFVGIRRKITTGKNKDEYTYPNWQIKNLERV